VTARTTEPLASTGCWSVSIWMQCGACRYVWQSWLRADLLTADQIAAPIACPVCGAIGHATFTNNSGDIQHHRH
jgi:hypothetical protein